MKPCVGLPHSKNPSLLEATSVSAAFSDATEPEKKNPTNKPIAKILDLIGLVKIQNV